MRKDRYNSKDNEHFHFLNLNPAGRHTGDCVCRALAFFLDLSWLTILWDLTAHCAETGGVLYYYTSYNGYLQRQGLVERKDLKGKKMTILDFINNTARPRKKYLIKTSNHMTCVSDKVIIDTWDCSGRIVDIYWEEKEGFIPGRTLYPTLFETMRLR